MTSGKGTQNTTALGQWVSWEGMSRGPQLEGSKEGIVIHLQRAGAVVWSWLKAARDSQRFHWHPQIFEPVLAAHWDHLL